MWTCSRSRTHLTMFLPIQVIHRGNFAPELAPLGRVGVTCTSKCRSRRHVRIRNLTGEKRIRNTLSLHHLDGLTSSCSQTLNGGSDPNATIRVFADAGRWTRSTRYPNSILVLHNSAQLDAWKVVQRDAQLSYRRTDTAYSAYHSYELHTLRSPCHMKVRWAQRDWVFRGIESVRDASRIRSLAYPSGCQERARMGVRRCWATENHFDNLVTE
jgi:hypothetical protein